MSELIMDGLRVGYRSSRRRAPVGTDRTMIGTDRVVVEAIDARITPGAVTAVIGPNGSGKSTLLRTVLGLQPALSGRVTLGGLDLATVSPRERARRTAVLLTERIETGLMTGREVVELGRYPHHGPLSGRLDAAEQRLIARLLDRLGATALAGERMSELSDGQRQRILLTRALVQQPDLLVLDEPSAFLDVGARVDLLALLGELAIEQLMTVLMSTHEVELALHSEQHLLLLHDGHATQGSPEDLIRSGAITAAFATARTGFDEASGFFRRRN